MSAPRDRGKLGEGIPLSVNAGINKKDYPVEMTSSKSWMKALGELGPTALMTKADLNYAYKHVMVASKDWRLQGFTWGGKVFFEIMLVINCITIDGYLLE